MNNLYFLVNCYLIITVKIYEFNWFIFINIYTQSNINGWEKAIRVNANSAYNGKEKISEGDNIGVNLRDELVNEAFMGGLC